MRQLVKHTEISQHFQLKPEFDLAIPLIQLSGIQLSKLGPATNICQRVKSILALQANIYPFALLRDLPSANDTRAEHVVPFVALVRDRVERE